jgi:transposase-like protein
MTTLTMQDEKRLKIIQRVFQGEMTVVQAALVLGISERQCYRVKARVGKAGAKGVVHGNRGRPCKRKTKEKVVNRIVELGVCAAEICARSRPSLIKLTLEQIFTSVVARIVQRQAEQPQGWLCASVNALKEVDL